MAHSCTGHYIGPGAATCRRSIPRCPRRHLLCQREFRDGGGFPRGGSRPYPIGVPTFVPNVITSGQNPAVKRLQRLRKPRVRREQGVLLAEGSREVARAHAAGLRLRELWLQTSETSPAGSPAPASNDASSLPAVTVDPAAVLGGLADWFRVLSQAGVPVTLAAPPAFEKIAYHQSPEGILGVFDLPAWSLEDIAPPTRTWVGGAESSGSVAGLAPLYLLAVGTEKPGNLGAMIRTAAAAGCAAVLAVGPAVDLFNPNVIRNSTGAIFSLPTLVVDESTALAWLMEHNIRLAAALADDGQDCFTADWADPRPDPDTRRAHPWALAVGPEHAGLSPAWRRAAHVPLTIPGPPAPQRRLPRSIPETNPHGVDSLNAANAAAVLLFEALRRRRAVNSSIPVSTPFPPLRRRCPPFPAACRGRGGVSSLAKQTPGQIPHPRSFGPGFDGQSLSCPGHRAAP